MSKISFSHGCDFFASFTKQHPSRNTSQLTSITWTEKLRREKEFWSIRDSFQSDSLDVCSLYMTSMTFALHDGDMLCFLLSRYVKNWCILAVTLPGYAVPTVLCSRLNSN